MSLVFIFLPPLFSIFLVTLGSSFFTTFVSVRLAIEGGSQLLIGVVASSYYAGMLIGSFFIEPYIIKLKHIHTYAILASLATAAVLLQAVYISPIFWILMRFIFGICFAGFYVIIESWILSKSSNSTREKILSIYMIILYATQYLSHFILSMLEIATLMPFIIAAIFCCLSLIPLAATTQTLPAIEMPKTRTLKAIIKIYRAFPFGFMGCLLSGFILSVVFSLIPNFAHFYHYDAALLMQFTILGGCLLQWPIMWVSNRLSKHIILLLTNFITMISALLIMVFYFEKSLVYFLSFILGGSSFTLYTLSMAKVCNSLKPTEMTNAAAILLFLYCLGSILSPIIASFLMEIVSYQFIYGYIFIISGLLTCFGLIKREVVLKTIS